MVKPPAELATKVPVLRYVTDRALDAGHWQGKGYCVSK